jgi:hypothetical protein
MRAVGQALLLFGLSCGLCSARTYDFDILCNGTPVGRHTVVVEDANGETDVTVDIALDVTLAGLELYRYRHSSHEVWRRGRLTSLHSETNDDGDELQLSVQAAEDGSLRVVARDGSRLVPADIVPSSYWNPELVNRGEILDSESGRTLKIAVTPLLRGRYQLQGDLRLQIEYQQGLWTGLHFSYFGAEIEYQPRPVGQLSATLP